MVQRIIKVPKHGGPDGQGLPPEVITELMEIIKNDLFNDEQIKQAFDLCLSASTQEQWNNTYRPQLLDFLQKNVII